MLFPTFQFALFFLIVFPLSWSLRRWEWPWKLFLVGASYFFYGYWDARFVWLLLFVTLQNYILTALMHRAGDARRKRRWLALNIALSLGVLGIFKYCDFFIDSFVTLFAGAGVDLPIAPLRIVLPIGISFFTFHAVSYTVDVYRGLLEPDLTPRGFLDFMVYHSFFPHLVAGPIVRGVHLLPQLKPGFTDRIREPHLAFALILGGLFKKMVLSTYLQTNIVDDVLANPFNYSQWEVLLAIYGFSVQIYCDFSGYTDIAIGAAMLLGFRFPDNFNAPYSASSIQDFWRRWHMTLSAWLRDYLYIPLGGNRHGPGRRALAVMGTMLLGGLWHGASINFVVWGGLHGILIVLHGIWRKGVAKLAGWDITVSGVPAAVLRILSIVLTFHLVSFLWVPFYHRDFSQALDVFAALGGPLRPLEQIDLLIVVAVITGIGLNFAGGTIRRAYLRLQQDSGPALRWAVNCGLALLILRLGPETVPPFIYFQF